MGTRRHWPRTRRTLEGLGRLSGRERLTTLHVVGVMSIVELTVRWVPLPKLSRAMGVPLRIGPDPEGHAVDPFEGFEEPARRQLECTAKVAGMWPFSDGPCLRQSLTGGHLIRRMHPALRLGVTGEGPDVGAHAWLEVDGRPLEPTNELRSFQNLPHPHGPKGQP